MADTQGTSQLIAALTGGDAIENAAYQDSALRLLQAQNLQAQRDKRIIDANMASQQSRGQEIFGKVFPAVMTNPDRGENAPFTMNEIAALWTPALQGGGFDLSNTASGFDKMIQLMARLQAGSAARDQGFTGVNQAAQVFKPTMVDTVQKVGDLMVEGNQTDSPGVNKLMTAMNAGVVASSDPSGTLKGKEQEIAYYTEVLGLPLDEAVKRAYGRRRIQIDDLGNVRSIDDTVPLGEAVRSVPIVGETTGTEPPAPPPGETLAELGPETTGPYNTAKRIAGQIVDLVPGAGLPSWAQDPVKGQSAFKLHMRGLVRSLSETRAFREQEYILNELSTMPGAAKGVGTLDVQINTLRQVLINMLAQEERDSNDPTVGSKAQGFAQNNARRIRNFLPILGGGAGQAQAVTPEMDARARAALIDVPGFNEMSPQQQSRYVELWLRDQGDQ